MGTLYIGSLKALQAMLEDNKSEAYAHISRLVLDLDDGLLKQLNLNRSELSHCLRSRSVPSKTAIIFLERNGKHSSMSYHFKGVSYGNFNH